jgi:DNA-binding IclR family transcriptional regulator
MAEQAGVNSLETGLRVARALADSAQPQALKDLAALARMSPAKAHRYLVSLIRAGLAEQDTESGRYRLGPLALELGLGALRGLDVLRLGSEAVVQLRAEIDETVMLSVWGNKGPVVVRWEESSRPIATNVRAGWVMPLANSATGRLFAAYLPGSVTAPLANEELARLPKLRDRFPALLEEIRSQGTSRIEGELQQGVGGIAAPVFGFGGGIEAALTAVGIEGVIDTGLGSRTTKAVERAAQALSVRLGFTGNTPNQGRS